MDPVEAFNATSNKFIEWAMIGIRKGSIN